MLSFQDRTFCTASECSKFGVSCERSLTNEIKAQAEKWWGGQNPPISYFENPKQLKCYDGASDKTETQTY